MDKKIKHMMLSTNDDNRFKFEKKKRTRAHDNASSMFHRYIKFPSALPRTKFLNGILRDLDY